LTHIRTIDLVSLAHGGQDSGDKRVRNAADTALSFAVFNLRQITVQMPAPVEAAVDILREASRHEVFGDGA